MISFELLIHRSWEYSVWLTRSQHGTVQSHVRWLSWHPNFCMRFTFVLQSELGDRIYRNLNSKRKPQKISSINDQAKISWLRSKAPIMTPKFLVIYHNQQMWSSISNSALQEVQGIRVNSKNPVAHIAFVFLFKIFCDAKDISISASSRTVAFGATIRLLFMIGTMFKTSVSLMFAFSLSLISSTNSSSSSGMSETMLFFSRCRDWHFSREHPHLTEQLTPTDLRKYFFLFNDDDMILIMKNKSLKNLYSWVVQPVLS